MSLQALFLFAHDIRKRNLIVTPKDYEGKFVKAKFSFDSFSTLQDHINLFHQNLHRTEKNEIIFLTKITCINRNNVKFEFVNLEMKTFYNGASPSFFDNIFEVIE